VNQCDFTGVYSGPFSRGTSGRAMLHRSFVYPFLPVSKLELLLVESHFAPLQNFSCLEVKTPRFLPPKLSLISFVQERAFKAPSSHKPKTRCVTAS